MAPSAWETRGLVAHRWLQSAERLPGFAGHPTARSARQQLAHRARWADGADAGRAPVRKSVAPVHRLLSSASSSGREPVNAGRSTAASMPRFARPSVTQTAPSVPSRYRIASIMYATCSRAAADADAADTHTLAEHTSTTLAAVQVRHRYCSLGCIGWQERGRHASVHRECLGT